MVVTESAGTAGVDATFLSQFDALALAFTDQGPLELRDRADEVALERGERVTGCFWSEEEAFGDELDADLPGGVFSNDPFEID